MADQLHMTLCQFRDTMLTAVARLEFQIRDTHPNQKPSHALDSQKVICVCPDVEEAWAETSSTRSAILPEQSKINSAILQSIVARMEALENRLSSLVIPASPAGSAAPASPADQRENINVKTIDEILTIQKDKNTRNVLVTSLRSTPALSAAVAAMNPPVIDLEEEEEDVISVPASEADTEGEVDEQLKKIMIKGVQYYMDDDNVVYTETEDGYEQIGTYDAKTDSLILDDGVEDEDEDEDDEDEDDEEAIEVEDFLYKGKTYQRDSEHNVYEDGEQIGTWNGKKIVLV